MSFKGFYRDILSANDTIIRDAGWNSNSIADDYGKFLAALMKKEFDQPVGIEFIAVGGSTNPAMHNSTSFSDRVKTYFDTVYNPTKQFDPSGAGDNWLWVKQIGANNVIYTEDGSTMAPGIADKLKITVDFEEQEPAFDQANPDADKYFTFNEFALVGVPQRNDNTYDTSKLFLINYVNHKDITKVGSMKLTRTLVLNFPKNVIGG